MTPAEARILLELSEGENGADAVRAAYLRRVRTARVDRDPDAFALLRAAYDLLSPPGGDGAAAAAARAALAREQSSVEARWSLLACTPYRPGAQAVAILLDGARRDPDEFLDELLFHFPSKVPTELLRSARSSAGPGRLLVVADVHAVQGRANEALDAFRAAMLGEVRPPMRLAVRSLLSMHARGQIDAAHEAFASLKRANAPAPDPRGMDAGLARAIAIVEELDRVGATFPLDLRALAATAAKQGDFGNTITEARFATRQWAPHDVQSLSAQLRRDAPMLAAALGLDLPPIKSGPSSRDFRIRLGWRARVAIVLISTALLWFRATRNRYPDVEKLVRDVNQEMVSRTMQDIDKACTDPNSEQCAYYRNLFAEKGGYADGGSSLDGSQTETIR